MCGIAGIVSSGKVQSHDWLTKAANSIKHRGPDSSGEWWSKEGGTGLAHRRLSIIDLSDAANQPMHDNQNKITMVYNGEIYNFNEIKKILQSKGYSFKTSSDTEVLLKSYICWGSKCVNYLEGMFAFAIYDENLNKLFIARDRTGEKPLYYYYDGKKILFCSELKGLLLSNYVNKKIDHRSLDCFLTMGFVPGELCIIQGVKKLPPGHFLEYNVNQNTIKIHNYWKLPLLESENVKQNEFDLLEELELLLTKSVKNQLVADVPVGILLSGGVDSSLITAIASHIQTNIKTFNVKFTNNTKYDESAHAKLIANKFGTCHTEINANDVSINLIQKLATQYDEPIADSSVIPTYLVCETVRKHCKVALGGDGADELFGGYPHYNRMMWMQKNLDFVPHFLKKFVSNSSGHLLPVGFKGRNWIKSLDLDLKKDVPFISNLFDQKLRAMLLNNNKSINFGDEVRKRYIIESNDLIERATKLDFKLFLSEDLLVKIDRASMLNSLELRSPFLDKDIIEFAYKKIPSNLKVKNNSRKIILKKLCQKILPESFDLDRKQGFSIPINEWLKKGEWLEYFESILYDNDCIFNQKMTKILIENHKKGFNNSERIFALVMFETWRKSYNLTL
tara:strand:- start:15831 stop:17690 length:1860 start_codon:yes stop_codon:yes gene_type:complete